MSNTSVDGLSQNSENWIENRFSWAMTEIFEDFYKDFILGRLTCLNSEEEKEEFRAHEKYFENYPCQKFEKCWN